MIKYKATFNITEIRVTTIAIGVNSCPAVPISMIELGHITTIK